MSRARNAAMKHTRRDSNEKEIVDALRAVGASVHRMDTPCDLLVGFRKRNWLLEVKIPGARLRPEQKEFHETWAGQISTVHSILEAFEIIGAKRKKTF